VVVPAAWLRAAPSAAVIASVRRVHQRSPLAVGLALLALGLAASGHRSSTAVVALLATALFVRPVLTGPARPRWRGATDNVARSGGWAIFLLGAAFDANAVGSGANVGTLAVAGVAVTATAVAGAGLVPTGWLAVSATGEVEPGLRPRPPRQRAGRVAVALVGVALAGALFLVGIHRQNDRFNPDPVSTHHDESAYVSYADQLLEFPDRIVHNRNQVPVYPYLISLFGSPSSSWQDLFEIGIVVNVLIGLAGSIAIGGYMARRTSPLAGVTAGLIAGFGLFLMLSGWVLADVLAALLLCLTLKAFMDLVRRPSALRGALVGCLAGVTQLTKPLVLPLIPLVVGVVVLAALVRRSGRERSTDDATFGRSAAAMASLVLLFVLVIAPYSANTARFYGSPTYNQNTAYYLWDDTTAQAFGPGGTLEAGSDYHQVRLPGGRTPSPSRYLATHSWWDVAYRFEHGTALEWEAVTSGAGSATYFGYGPFLIALAGASLLALGLNRQLVRDRLRRDWPALLFLALVGFSLQLSIAWFTSYGIGNRYLLPLAVPGLAGMTFVTQRGLSRWSVGLRDRVVRLDRVVLAPLCAGAVVLALWASLINAGRTLGGY